MAYEMALSLQIGSSYLEMHLITVNPALH